MMEHILTGHEVHGYNTRFRLTEKNRTVAYCDLSTLAPL